MTPGALGKGHEEGIVRQRPLRHLWGFSGSCRARTVGCCPPGVREHLTILAHGCSWELAATLGHPGQVCLEARKVLA